jgi:eukaryotic-like serine/threonine-protein kinase
MSHDLKLLSDLLDEALDLDAAASEEFLDKIEKMHPALVPTLRDMLRVRATLSTDQLIALNGRAYTVQSAAAVLRQSAPQDAAFATALQPGMMIGPYRLQRCLGEGGMASVWLAERNDETLKRTVALKLLHAWRHTREVVERFARERDILAQLTHPNIARLYDAGVTESGLPWIALEHVDGQEITTYADQHRLSIRQRVSLILQVMDAVQYAHQTFVVHRDIKPGNILIDANGSARLLDFGIAKLIRPDGAAAVGVETALTEASGRTLTLRYAAPEQIEGGVVTAATDVFALGLVTAELLSGAHPRVLAAHKIPEQAVLEAAITRPSRGDIKHAAAEHRGRASITQLQSELKGDLDTVVMKSLARDPLQRYATVSAFADDLKAWLERRPIRARSPSLAYQAKLFLLRNRWPAAMAATVVVVALFGAFQSWKNNRAMNEQRARTERLQLFMANLLGDAEPSGAPDNGVVTAKELVDRGRERAERDYAEQPMFRGELLSELARVYLRIGETDTGMAVLEDAIQLLESHAVVDDPTLNAARAQLGGLLLTGIQRGKALNLLEGAIRDCSRQSTACESVKGDAHLYLAHDTQLGAARMRQHIQEAIGLFEKARGPESMDMLQALNMAADIERWQGNTMAAKGWLVKAEAIAAKHPPKDKEYIRLKSARAAIQFEDGDYARAAESLDRLIDGGMFGDQTGTRGYVFAFRARVAGVLGQPALALEHAQRGRAATDRDQSSRVYAQIELYEARAHSLLGQHDLSARAVQSARATLQRADIAESSDISLMAMHIAGEVLARGGDLAAAQKRLSETLAKMRNNPPTNALDLVHTLDALGAVSLALGDVAEATRLHQEELAMLEKRVATAHPLRLRARLQLARTRQPATPAATGEIEAAVVQLRDALPPSSVYLQSLSAVAAGTFASNRAFLLF